MFKTDARMHCCRNLEDALKAMQTSLPLVSELHHPAMRPRHWKQIMKVSVLPVFKDVAALQRLVTIY